MTAHSAHQRISVRTTWKGPCSVQLFPVWDTYHSHWSQLNNPAAALLLFSRALFKCGQELNQVWLRMLHPVLQLFLFSLLYAGRSLAPKHHGVRRFVLWWSTLFSPCFQHVTWRRRVIRRPHISGKVARDHSKLMFDSRGWRTDPVVSALLWSEIITAVGYTLSLLRHYYLFVTL